MLDQTVSVTPSDLAFRTAIDRQQECTNRKVTVQSMNEIMTQDAIIIPLYLYIIAPQS